MQLSAVKEGLEEDLKCSKSELESCRDQLEVTQVELSKIKVHSHTLDKRNKSLRGKQASLLSRIDELDQECSGLKEELEQVEESRQRLQDEVKEMQTNCNELKEQLCAEQGRLAESHREQENLIQEVSELEQQIGEVKGQLDQEKHNCRLLMDYPFIKQTGSDYRAHIASLSGRDSEKQISANTVRILLLEEQNTELRERAILSKSQYDDGGCYQVRQATPLWRKSFLSELQEEQVLAQQPSNHKLSHQPHPHTAADKDERQVQSSTKAYGLKLNSRHQWDARNGRSNSRTDSSAKSADSSVKESRASSAKLRGRLGHLVAAISEAQCSNSPTKVTNEAHCVRSGSSVCARVYPSNAWVSTDRDNALDHIELHTCPKCDKMYSSRGDLEHHLSTCML